MRKSGDSWSDGYFTQTRQHQAGVAEYSEDISMSLDLDTTYVVRLAGKRVHKDEEDRVIVSEEHEKHITCTGLALSIAVEHDMPWYNAVYFGPIEQ